MKIVGLIASLLMSLFSIGQKSYYFSDPLPSSDKSTMAIDSKWFGHYESKAEGRSYEVTMEGIYVISTSISSISREAIRESTLYDVRDNFIFGVIANDSLPCVLEGERYYFGIKNKDVLIGNDSKNQLTRVSSNEYIVNFYENGYYLPELLVFERNKLIIKDFDYDFETKIFDGIESIKRIPTEYHELIVLSPNESEYNELVNNGIYPDVVEFKKIKK